MDREWYIARHLHFLLYTWRAEHFAAQEWNWKGWRYQWKNPIAEKLCYRAVTKKYYDFACVITTGGYKCPGCPIIEQCKHCGEDEDSVYWKLNKIVLDTHYREKEHSKEEWRKLCLEYRDGWTYEPKPNH